MGQTYGQQVRLASGLNVLLGLWLVMSPYGFGYQMLNPPFWNSVVVGCAVTIFATLRLVLPFRFPEVGWINVVLGAYLILSPFLFGFAHVTAALWNSVGSGILVVLLAGWSISAGTRGARLTLG